MSRIISGYYGGRVIANPRHNIRPTTGKVKEYIFNVLQRCDDMAVLDLFSGTGALGIEALSRGAETVTFVDNNIKSIQLIKKNLADLRADTDSVSVIRQNAFRYMETCSLEADLILADPPYDLPVSVEFFENTAERLTAGGRFIFEYGSRSEIDHGKVPCLRKKIFGDTSIWIFGKTGE